MSLEKLFDQIHDLPRIPKVVQELIDNFNNPDINADVIAENIKKDQGISLKILRLANSARYGAGRKIASIDSAVVMLGFDALKTLVVASGLTGAFKEIPGLDKKQFWRDSFSVANICKIIGKHTDVDHEVAFTCGMLHNIGETLLHMSHGETMQRINKMVDEGAQRTHLEQNQFGYDYTEVGAELARRWNFPEEIQLAMRYQADPLNEDSASPYAAVIYIASYLNRAIQAEKDKEEILEKFPADVAEPMNLDLLTFYETLIEMFAEEDDIDTLIG